jgi:hypothetical protein
MGITKGDTDDSFGWLLTNINDVRALLTARCCMIGLLLQLVWQNATHVKSSYTVMYINVCKPPTAVLLCCDLLTRRAWEHFFHILHLYIYIYLDVSPVALFFFQYMLLDSKLVFDFSQKTPEHTPLHPILSAINYITSSLVSSLTKFQVG